MFRLKYLGIILCASFVFLGAGCNSSAPDSSSSTQRSSTDCYCSSNRYNCDDFSSHRKAQSLYECCYDSVGHDVHRLDRDSDGSACETLP